MAYVPQSHAQAERARLYNQSLINLQSEYDDIAEGQEERAMDTSVGGLLGGLAATLGWGYLKSFMPFLPDNVLASSLASYYGTKLGGELGYGDDPDIELDTEFRYGVGTKAEVQADIDAYEANIEAGIEDTAEMAGITTLGTGLMSGVGEYMEKVAAADVLETSVKEFSTADVEKLRSYVTEGKLEYAEDVAGLSNVELVDRITNFNIGDPDLTWLSELGLSESAQTTISNVTENMQFWGSAIQPEGTSMTWPALKYAAVERPFDLMDLLKPTIGKGISLYSAYENAPTRKLNI